ncbi:TPA: maltose ABC transporter permease MalG [Candidatus Acetothermia bacterium]|nr:maltose ABC transporter permease MalG [Candidatus Acetothermia bacterium]
MYSRHTLLGKIFRHLLVWAMIAFTIFPVIWIFSASINPGNTLFGLRFIPQVVTWNHYLDLFTNPLHPFGLWLWNSIKVSGTASLVTVFLTALGAYALSRFRFRGRRTGLLALLLIQMFPQMLAMVAIYLLLLSIGRYIPWLGLNTHAGLIMVYLGGAMGFNTWLMKSYFDTIPHDLEESAMVDGATHFQAFLRIILPLARPILAVIFILTFIGTYSDFLLPSILLTGTRQFTFAVGLRLFIQGQYATRWGIFAAACMLGAIPIMVVFLSLQRFLISGLTRGGVKG